MPTTTGVFAGLLTSQEGVRPDLLFGPDPPRHRLKVDVPAGTSSFVRHSRVVNPVLTHLIGSFDRSYVYLGEELRLAAADRDGASPLNSLRVIRLIVAAKWLRQRRCGEHLAIVRRRLGWLLARPCRWTNQA